jgi:hypothetical protein
VREAEGTSGRAGPKRSAADAVGTGLLLTGLAALLWWLFKIKPTAAGDEDSPIMIKSGSLSVALHVDGETNVKLEQVPPFAYKLKTSLLKKKHWDVAVAELESGFPVKGQATVYKDVKSVSLQIVDDDNKEIDRILMTFDAAGALTVSADNDRDFSSNVRKRRVKKSKKHKFRAFHKKVMNSDDFEIGEVVIQTTIKTSLPAGPEYVFAFDFHD